MEVGNGVESKGETGWGTLCPPLLLKNFGIIQMHSIASSQAILQKINTKGDRRIELFKTRVLFLVFFNLFIFSRRKVGRKMRARKHMALNR